MKKFVFGIIFLVLVSFEVNAQEIAVLKYNGGGDWYANPTALPNLIKFCNTNLQTSLNEKLLSLFLVLIYSITFNSIEI